MDFFFSLSFTYLEGCTRFYCTQPSWALRLFPTCLFLSLSQRSTYHKMTSLRPTLLSCLSAINAFWQPAPFLFSLRLPVAPEPNYPPRTLRSYHKARSRFSVHHAHYTGLQNSQHTCSRLERGVGEAVANPPLIWPQVQIYPSFGFQGRLLEGYSANRVSYLLYWSLAAFSLLAQSHSPLEQMGVCYLWTVENSALQTFTQLPYLNGFHCCSLRGTS